MKYDTLKETALANFELLLTHWKVEYKKVTEKEYDLLATWRSDRDFGSVRFNIEKGQGADFAGTFLSEKDYNNIGSGFCKDDFAGYTNRVQANIGFDIIGLCQRIYNLNTYLEATKYITDDIREVFKGGQGILPSQEAAEKRKKEQQEKAKKLIIYANDLWESCKNYNIKDTPGEVYLTSRKIFPEKNIRFHPCINYSTLKKCFPALIFKVQTEPYGPLVAIHRIFLKEDGSDKANIPNPKMALASIKGAGIWFGEPSTTLYISEGPENALSLRSLGAAFVVCTVFGTNLHNINIPGYVKKIIIVPDVDKAGLESYHRALDKYKLYTKMGVTVQEILIPKVVLPNGKLADINNILMGQAPHG